MVPLKQKAQSIYNVMPETNYNKDGGEVGLSTNLWTLI